MQHGRVGAPRLHGRLIINILQETIGALGGWLADAILTQDSKEEQWLYRTKTISL